MSALRAKVGEPLVEALPDLEGARWALLIVLATAVLSALGLSFFGRVEVTSIAPGALLVEGGPRPVLAQASGQVMVLAAQAGDAVRAGQTLAEVDATELRAREGRLRRQLSWLTTANREQALESTRLHERATGALRRKRAVLRERLGLKRSALAERVEHQGRLEQLAREGAASWSDALQVRQAERSSREDLLLVAEQIADIELELNDRAKELRTEQDGLTRQLKEVEESVAEALALVDLATVRAPVSGRVESLLVTVGQVVPAGVALARIIPDGAATRVVAFAPAKDAAFLRPGLDAEVEFGSLPVSDFGKASARVVRVSRDVATLEEMAGILGGSASDAAVRIELELIPDAVLERVERRLRSGERVTVRVNTRERRVISLLFDFVRKWYPT